MSREKFMKELEYLLQDIQEEDKADALQYYRDYLEEAGSENESQVISEFGSPERIAAIIRSDIAGNLSDGGEFTESGYQDQRFRDPNYQMAKRYDLPEVDERSAHGRSGKAPYEETGPRSNKAVKIGLWIVLVIVAFPVIIGIGGGALGILGGLLGVLAALVVTVGVVTAAFLIVGVALLVVGVVTMMTSGLTGMLIMGIGLLMLGLGLLSLVVAILFYGKCLPCLIRGCVDMISSLFHRGRRNKV